MAWISAPIGGGIRVGTRLPPLKYPIIVIGLCAFAGYGWGPEGVAFVLAGVVWFFIACLAILALCGIIMVIVWPILQVLKIIEWCTRTREPEFKFSIPINAHANEKSSQKSEGNNVVPFIKASREERERVMTIQEFKCANPYCNTNLRGGSPHWDHIIPRSRGGTDSVHNMQWLCGTCNLNKRDMDWREFLFRYAAGLGQDPVLNPKPWQDWMINRNNHGLHTECG